MARGHYTTSSNHTTSTQNSGRSSDSYEAPSTAPTSLYDSPRPSKEASCRDIPASSHSSHEDTWPSTACWERSSVDTYSSQASSEDFEDMGADDSVEEAKIPPLPTYRHEITDTHVRPSTPEDFAALFPSMNRLSIRHDDFTSDGNMNLRVDTSVSGSRRVKTIQLFHLRMYELGKREFSLRRYCRDSGREVCNSKRKYTEPAGQSRPNLQRSMSSAMKNLARPPLRRMGTTSSRYSTKSRPETSYSASASTSAEDEFNQTFDRTMSFDKKQKAHQAPTNTIKLEFSNYARVDVERCGNKNSKRYQFSWWGHKYSWRRSVDKLTDVVSFHLFKDGHNKTPVAHIVPETRSPNQIAADEYAGGWVPPSHMWISDLDLINGITDVADVIVATGLIALVDNCIKERWGAKKPRHISLPNIEYASPKALVQHVFSRHNSDDPAALRRVHPVAAY